jgi:hypothetical protein
LHILALSTKPNLALKFGPISRIVGKRTATNQGAGVPKLLLGPHRTGITVSSK